MTGIQGLVSGVATAQGGAKADTPEKIRESAGQFEALLIGQMLRQARESGSGGWMGEGSDQSSSPLTGMAEEQLAQVLASNGGLGLANMVAGGIASEERNLQARRTGVASGAATASGVTTLPARR